MGIFSNIGGYMKKALLVLLSALMLFAFASCDGRYIPTPKNGYVEIKEGTTAADINEIINSKPFVEGIWSENNVVIKMRISDEITVNRNFGFHNVTFEAELPSDQTYPPSDKETNNSHGIEITSENGSKVTFDHVIFRNYTHAITVSGQQNNVEILSSTFENCFKGIFASGLGNLYISNTTMKDMGAGSVPPAEGDESETAKMARSGSGIDINQTKQGGIISITNSNFTNCGKEGDVDVTSGAIKIKLRNPNNYPEGPDDSNGSFVSVTITGNTFSQNRKDVVIGTTDTSLAAEVTKTTYPESLAENTTIQDCELEDNSGNGYVIENGKLIAETGTTTT